MPLSKLDINGSMQLIIETFLELRPELLQHYGNVKHSSKTDTSPVTELDIKVEQIVKERLIQKFPHIGFHGEETEDIESTINVNAQWIVDPIDGTSSFIHGLPYCTNMAGLVVDGIIEAGIIYQFATGDLYTAVRGQGAFKNDTQIHVKNTPLSDSIVFSNAYVYKHLYEHFEPHGVGVYAPIGASGYEYTRLAQGSIQGVTKLNCKSQIHDNVPGVLIASEAGASILPFDNSEYDYRCLDFVIGTPDIISMIKNDYEIIKQKL